MPKAPGANIAADDMSGARILNYDDSDGFKSERRGQRKRAIACAESNRIWALALTSHVETWSLH